MSFERVSNLPLMARVIALFLGALLVSCGTTRHLAPSNTEELTQNVLFVRKLPDGTVTHSWKRIEEVDLSQYKLSPSVRGPARRIVRVAAVSRPRDCDEENRQCIDDCMDRPLPRGFGHITSNGTKGGKETYCRNQCWQPYLDCAELERLRPQEFAAVDDAVDWLKRNGDNVLVGTTIISAGVAFILLAPEIGLIVLAPAAGMAL
jgi:hypothetical protein